MVTVKTTSSFFPPWVVQIFFGKLVWGVLFSVRGVSCEDLFPSGRFWCRRPRSTTLCWTTNASTKTLALRMAGWCDRTRSRWSPTWRLRAWPSTVYTAAASPRLKRSDTPTSSRRLIPRWCTAMATARWTCWAPSSVDGGWDGRSSRWCWKSFRGTNTWTCCWTTPPWLTSRAWFSPPEAQVYSYI